MNQRYNYSLIFIAGILLPITYASMHTLRLLKRIGSKRLCVGGCPKNILFI